MKTPYLLQYIHWISKQVSKLQINCNWYQANVFFFFYIKEISFGLIFSILSLHFFVPQARPYTWNLISIQYQQDGLAEIGLRDAWFVLFSILCLTFLRLLMIDHILKFIAFKFHLHTSKAVTRFVEQSWSIFYYTTSFTTGFYLLSKSDYWMSTENLWRGWPHYQIPICVKMFYLMNLSSWIHQIYTLHVEERRKDHYQMFTHHIITCLLVVGSYYYYYTRVGHVIMILMDFVDIFLSLAKVFKYFDLRTLCDSTFGFFMICWLICRHGIYNYIVYTAATSAFELIEQKCYEDAEGGLIRCFTPKVHWTLVVLLCMLQVTFVIWFGMIVRVALKVVRGSGAEDTRSDDEDDWVRCYCSYFMLYIHEHMYMLRFNCYFVLRLDNIKCNFFRVVIL